jgi:AcrR family transcriptional regulator
MSLRAPSRHDATAQRFLRAAVQLIDAYLDDQPGAERPARLRAIHFPAALDWLRTEDVIRLAASAEGLSGTSRKAFFNRWPTREEFLPDALVYALVHEEAPGDPQEQARQMPADAASAQSFAEAVLRISDELLESLLRHPRSYLTLHIGPLLPQHPQLWAALLPAMRQGSEVWADGYAALLADLGLVLRPGWTPQRLALALQAMLDGFVLRYRIQPDDYPTSRWEGASIFADSVLAMVLGLLDTGSTGEAGSVTLDRLIARAGPAPPDAAPPGGGRDLPARHAG